MTDATSLMGRSTGSASESAASPCWRNHLHLPPSRRRTVLEAWWRALARSTHSQERLSGLLQARARRSRCETTVSLSTSAFSATTTPLGRRWSLSGALTPRKKARPSALRVGMPRISTSRRSTSPSPTWRALTEMFLLMTSCWLAARQSGKKERAVKRTRCRTW